MRQERKLRVFIGGGSRGNPGHGACSAVFFDQAGGMLCVEGKYLGRCSGEFAECGGLRLALAAAARLGGRELELFTGSEALLRLFAGGCRAEDAALASLPAELRKARKLFGKISLSRVPRGKNKEADGLVARILDNARRAAPALDRSLAAENAAAAGKTRRKR